MAQLPTGTVTFLFSDIVGSTNLARTFSEAWSTIQDRHHGILRQAIRSNRGYVFQVIGDEFQAAFAEPHDACMAALAAQTALREEDWGETGSVHVRMGIHTGPATVKDDKYEGYVVLSYTQRLMTSAYGDQILVSATTEALLRGSLPENATLRTLGKYRLKDFERGEYIFQVVAQGLPADFPPLKTLDIPENNLPVQLTSFIGRSTELDEARQLLTSGRLLTLTGPGGSGKTRLALQVASQMIEYFKDGVFFIALEPISEADLVLPTIAQTLKIKEIPGRSIEENLIEYLKDKSLLLLLDNFEQVISGAPAIAELLVACKDLKLIITSREVLHISGEHEYPVPSLKTPNLTQMPSLDAISKYAAVELFLQRAQAVKPEFRITKDTAPLIAEICYRLDGLPLAIELAAARIKLLPLRAMLDQLEHPLEFLIGGARDLPARQQTLRNTIAWSYNLLNENEQLLFRRLSVFVGGCSLEAIEAVAGDEPSQGPILDLLGSLLDKSLLQEAEDTNNQPRFKMLETLREYGLTQLVTSNEEVVTRQRHARFFLEIAEQGEAALASDGQVKWINQMEQEYDNLRAALEWSKAVDRESAGKEELCLRLASAMGYFWEARSYFSEGRRQLSAVLLTEGARGQTAARANLLIRSAELAYRQSDFIATATLAKESLDIYRKIGDQQGMASALIKLGNAVVEMGDYSTASQHLEEALNIWREQGDQHGTARAMVSFGWVALRSGNYPLAKERLEEALSISRGLSDTRNMGFELSGLGEVALRQGNYRLATQLVEESLELRKQLGNKWGIGVSLGILGWIAMREENWEQAKARLSESLGVRQEIGDLSGSAWCLERLAAVAQALGQKEKAVRLFGASASLRATIRSVIDPSDQPAYDSKIRTLQAEFGKKRFKTLFEEGRALTYNQAFDYVLDS